MSESPPPIKVFVHLAYEFGLRKWRKKWAEGTILGINHEFPYGYILANNLGCSVTYSEAGAENPISRGLRYFLRLLFGFDLVHAWRHRRQFLVSDVIWTHTESQYLAVAMVLAVCRAQPTRPIVVGQTVWLFDKWNKIGRLRRKFYSWLLERVDVITVLSPVNLAFARKIFPNKRIELVLFGIDTSVIKEPKERVSRPLRIMALGNDRDRDWNVIAQAFDNPSFQLLVVSARAPKRLFMSSANTRLASFRTNSELMEAFAWADIMVVALKPNMHASGITVIQEAVVQGIPTVCTKVGGLEAYFSADQVTYVPFGDAEALRDACLSIASCSKRRLEKIRNAQLRLGPHDLGSFAYVMRHVEISKDVLDSRSK